MAVQIVMDRTGDSRHHSSRRCPGSGEGGAAFRGLTDAGFTAATRPDRVRYRSSGRRSECGRNRVLSQACRRLTGRRHAAH